MNKIKIIDANTIEVCNIGDKTTLHFDKIETYEHNLIKVKKGKFWGVLGKNAEFILPLKFTKIEFIANIFLATKKDQLYLYLSDGKMLDLGCLYKVISLVGSKKYVILETWNNCQKEYACYSLDAKDFGIKWTTKYKVARKVTFMQDWKRKAVINHFGVFCVDKITHLNFGGFLFDTLAFFIYVLCKIIIIRFICICLDY